MNELRRHRRMKIPLKLELRHPATGKILVAASDMSDGGVFLVTEETSKLKVGESVLVRTLGLGIRGTETGPPLVMCVVRKTHEGIGLKLEKTASANLESWDSENLTRQAIRQVLFIANDFEQMLVTSKQSNWGLPSRQLLSGDSWQLGIEAMLVALEAQGAIAKDCCVVPESVCMPAALGEPGSIDLLVPCKLVPQNLADDLGLRFHDGASFKWLDATALSNLIPELDSKLVDKALKQVRH